MWFEKLTGFREETPAQVRENLSVDGGVLKSRVNGREFVAGTLETPSLGELRERVRSTELPSGGISVREVVADVQQLHASESNAGALFQVASQFNLLEMVSPQVTPEQGVGRYESDRTQGPACAVAAGAGTIYRNYFADVDGEKGQSDDRQIDCLADIGEALGNSDDRLWEMRNGYSLATEEGLREITHRLSSASEAQLDELRQLLRIGIQWSTQVTIADSSHTVSQAYCSALPVAYSRHSSELWARFAQLILDATYEASFCASILNSLSDGNRTLYLTLIGGGAFGNETDWIMSAIHRSVELYQNVELDVAIVSYGQSKDFVQELIGEFSRQAGRG